jgi:hypothetical protein
MASKKEPIIPKVLLEVKNPEKKDHEVWNKGRDLMNFIRPFRWMVTGNPNCGKSSAILNYLIRAKPGFSRIFLLHPRSYDPQVPDADQKMNKNLICESCEIPEYDGVEYFALKYLPTEQFYVGLKGFSCLIIDDIDLQTYTRRVAFRQRVVNKTLSYCSTHNNLTVILTSQSPTTQLPNICFSMANVITLFGLKDKYKIRVLGQKLSFDSKQLIYYMQQLKSSHDNITFDLTLNSPMPIRLNMYEDVPEYVEPTKNENKKKKENVESDGGEQVYIWQNI